MQHWLLKSEPLVRSRAIQVAKENDGKSWTGVSIHRMQDIASRFDVLAVGVIATAWLGELKTPFISNDVRCETS